LVGRKHVSRQGKLPDGVRIRCRQGRSLSGRGKKAVQHKTRNRFIERSAWQMHSKIKRHGGSGVPVKHPTTLTRTSALYYCLAWLARPLLHARTSTSSFPLAAYLRRRATATPCTLSCSCYCLRESPQT
ncbi:unnamed protein product, partial [Ectocarpus fasciculatus]